MYFIYLIYEPSDDTLFASSFAMPQLPSSDDLDLDLTSNSHNLCPYCDEILPDILPEKVQNQLQNLQNKLITV